MIQKFKTLVIASSPIYITILLQGIVAAVAVLFLTIPKLTSFPPGMNYWEFSKAVWGMLARTSSIAWISVFYAIAGILVFHRWFKKLDVPVHRYITLEASYGRTKKLILAIVLLAFSMQVLSESLVAGLYSVMPKAAESYQELLDNSGLTSNVSFLLGLYTVLLGPICEEFAFRGVALNILLKDFTFWPANIIQALFFAEAHLNLIQGIYAFVIGCLFGYITYTTKSIYISISLHILFNAAGLFIPDLLSGTSFYLAVAVLTCAIAAFVVSLKFIRNLKKIEETFDNEIVND